MRKKRKRMRKLVRNSWKATAQTRKCSRTRNSSWMIGQPLCEGALSGAKPWRLLCVWMKKCTVYSVQVREYVLSLGSPLWTTVTQARARRVPVLNIYSYITVQVNSVHAVCVPVCWPETVRAPAAGLSGRAIHSSTILYKISTLLTGVIIFNYTQFSPRYT